MHKQNKQHETQVHAKLRHDIRSRFTLLIGILDIMSEDEAWEAQRASILNEKKSVERCLENVLASIQRLSLASPEHVELRAFEIVRATALPCLESLTLFTRPHRSPSPIENDWAKTLLEEVENFIEWCGASQRSQDTPSPRVEGMDTTSSNGTPGPSTKQLIVIDDEPHNLDVVRMFLKKEDWSILTFTSGSEARHALRSSPCHVILLDLDLNDVSGIEILESIREEPTTQHIPVIMITGSEDAKALETCRQAGATFILSKPFSKAQLIELLKSKLT